jgi:hypothetical protein
MKRKLIPALFLLFFFFKSNAQIEFVSQQNGTITVSTVGSAKEVNNAISEAEKYVFYAVFYRGIPGSTVKNGLMDITEAEAETRFREYFDNFYKSRYQTFITTTQQNGGVIKGKKHNKTVSFYMTVNVDALRKDLEDNQVIRKFGY